MWSQPYVERRRESQVVFAVELKGRDTPHHNWSNRVFGKVEEGD